VGWRKHLTREKVDQRLLKQEVRYDRESRMKNKRSENLDTLEEVFDRRTIMTVLRLLNTGKLKEIHGVIKSGKESRVYRGTDGEGGEVAIKIFLTTSAIFRQGRLKYLVGDQRFREIPHSTADIVDMWTLKEYKNLQLAQEAGINVPTPIAVEKNVLVLSFIGKDGKPAPLLRDVPLSSPTGWYKAILGMVKQLYRKAKLVHGDLSEYNIMVPNGYPVLIDFGQAVTTEHPQAQAFLERDIENLNHYFSQFKVKTVSPQEFVKKVAKA